MADTRNILVYYDGEQVDSPLLMGTLACDHIRGKEIFSFEFDASWLSDRRFRSFDPDLQMFGGKQYVPQGKDNFGIFLDSTPDRWGRVLLERREAEMARLENRKPRNLFETDYLLGVYDGSRMGALRFKTDPSGEFLDNDSEMATPPWTSLRELENASLHLED
ncbi:MAG: type II toxin-antitoxin system HipA family toxin, partial [Bacteroidales bacterium]|nr:type II toxin-antitoxin system HipA family toxin [Bacteroidales bacterium]